MTPGPNLQTLFGFTAPVSRGRYAATGFALAAVKYALDAGLVALVTGKFWDPQAYLSPLYFARQEAIGPVPQWLAVTLVVFALPFLWIGTSMSVRRALNAGLSAWTGLLFLVPVLHYVAILVLCLLPTRVDVPRDAEPALPVPATVQVSLLGVAGGLGIGVAMTAISVLLLGQYGRALFVLTPVLMGATAAWLHNRDQPRSLPSTYGVAAMTVTLTGLALLVFALEGVVCLAMALPLALVAALLGAAIGRTIALQRHGTLAQFAVVLLALPGLATAERALPGPPVHEVVSTAHIRAPPAVVWRHVVQFSDLTEPPQWFFALGIAYPKRATIVGTGVGAVRHCEFSTGPFVDPITVWDPPRRLAFDARSQPPPMTELSPYRHVVAPHLDGYMTSRRGEFRLYALADGTTRLEGSTWYTLAIAPEPYWQLWADALVHAIHLRVLRHIGVEAEAEVKTGAAAARGGG